MGEYVVGDVSRRWDDQSALFEWLVDVGKGNRRDLEQDVRLALGHPDSEIRARAITVLAAYFELDDMRDVCWNLISDPESVVSMAALLSWTSYYRASGDVAVAERLVDLARGHELAPDVRALAVASIGRVLVGVGPESMVFPMAEQRRLISARSHQEFDELIDWQTVVDFIDRNR